MFSTHTSLNDVVFLPAMIGGLPLAMTEDNPFAHGIVLKAIMLAPLVMLAGLLMHTPLFLEKFQDLRARAGEEGWYRALMFPKNNFIYVPWPKHSHPVARQAQWGGLETSDDVLRRGTLLKVVDAQIAKQKIRPARFVAAALLVLFISLARKSFLYGDFCVAQKNRRPGGAILLPFHQASVAGC